MNDLTFEIRPLERVFGPLEPADGENLVDAIYREVRSRIVDLSLPPDMPLSEKDLAAVFEASKTPVREALIRLSRDGLVRVVPKSGTFVAPISLDKYLEAVFIRERLETGCVLRLASVGLSNAQIVRIRALLASQAEAYEAEDFVLVFRLDDQFHQTLFEFAGIAGAWVLMNSAKAEIDRVRRLKNRLGIRRKDAVMDEHSAIVDALIEKDGLRAEEAMRNNIGAFEEELGYLSNHPKFLDTLDSFNELVNLQRKGRRSRKLF
ncbi:MAG: GntR family transcriptional regulator [Woeseiaceae bacterium]